MRMCVGGCVCVCVYVHMLVYIWFNNIGVFMLDYKRLQIKMLIVMVYITSE